MQWHKLLAGVSGRISEEVGWEAPQKTAAGAHFAFVLCDADRNGVARDRFDVNDAENFREGPCDGLPAVIPQGTAALHGFCHDEEEFHPCVK